MWVMAAAEPEERRSASGSAEGVLPVARVPAGSVSSTSSTESVDSFPSESSEDVSSVSETADSAVSTQGHTSTKSKAGRVKYRVQGKRFFLTYPRCEVEKEVALANLQKLWPDATQALIAKEKHADGGGHLHLLVIFGVRKNFRTPTWADQVVGKHGDYGSVRSLKATVRYLLKEDTDPLAWNFDATAVLAGGASTFAIVEGLLDSGTTIAGVKRLHPGVVLNYRKKMEDYLLWKERTEKEVLPLWRGIEPIRPCREPGLCDVVSEWCNSEIMNESREFKAPNLWIHGVTNMGKNTFVAFLEHRVRVYWVPMDEDFLDLYEDGRFDLAVFDEFRAQKRLTWFNRFVQGGTMCLRVKCSQRMKRQRIPCIVLSNYEPRDAYSKLSWEILQTVYSRFHVVRVTSFMGNSFRFV